MMYPTKPTSRNCEKKLLSETIKRLCMT